ncbi:phosphotransferase enzyme family protein [Emericellopsis atlantica]|uniref:Phosphotransferase enzyme family protein n=1 Tax=Emericellopsis atlantica TaxID=2614577 RepID=A0A9P7ZVW6_9HYPO|nr:phosphotransferase enzyme family protein [Emericellopsis atlantica]KAG9258665.1 phosphotransferase enzyme family protein [Emericellopsis atlantica]
MEWDELAEEESQKLFAGWVKLLMRQSPELPLKLAGRHCPGKHPVEASRYTTGSYNIVCTVTFDDGSKAVVRFPIFGRSRLRKEKTNDELIAMDWVSRHTVLPIPRVLGSGLWACGPYTVISFVEGTLLSTHVRDPSVQSPSLDPNVSTVELERAYRSMATVVLELSKLEFPIIGAIGFDSGTWRVAKRPLTLNMNELVRVGNLPPGIFTEESFQNASDYFQELASHQLLHLRYQRNNAVKDEQDCRKKYIARCLFRRIAREMPTKPRPFHLYCDDLRPSNVLVNDTGSDFEVTGVIDWEFTYVAPVEFTHVAPWWLLFESPEAWESDLRQFLARFKPRLELFLKCLRAIEDDQLQQGTLRGSQRLSEHMAPSMDNGRFWFCLAARKSFMFDDIYWQMIDEQYFGKFTTLESRLALLTQEERDGLDGFVQEKLKQAAEKTLDEHLTFDEVLEL